MQSGAGGGHEIGVLDDEEVAGGVGGGDFEGEGAVAEGVGMTEAILAGGDGMERGRG